jgi:hypothetical protein
MTEVINKIIITEAARFDYENTDFFGERKYPSWEQLLAAVGCDRQKALADAGYDKREVYKRTGCWRLCLEKADGDQNLARQMFRRAKADADDLLTAAYQRAERNTQKFQEKAFALAGQYEKPLRKLNPQPLKRELEEYIDNMNRAGLLSREHYFRYRYYDDTLDRMLMLFLYRDRKDGIMQNWRLQGICLAEDWSEEAEDDGRIRNWLNTPLDGYPDEDDRAVKARVKKILEQTEKTLFDNVLKEVRDAFECERDKETAEKLAFLQGVCFEFRGRRHGKKENRSR